MYKLSFEGIGEVVATMLLEGEANGGDVVKMTGSGQVGPCEQGEAFCGVMLKPRLPWVGVQVKGFMQVKYSGELAVGPATLCADGTGGVCAGQSGTQVLVVSVDESTGMADICL